MATSMVVTDKQGNLSALAFPAGMIVMWNGPSTLIPAGWVLCDGRNDTPDLRSKFVLGGSDAGAGGGSTSVTLRVEHIPNHTHTVDTSFGGGENGGNFNSTGYPSSVRTFQRYQSPGCNECLGTPVVLPLPPYYTLCYVMKAV